MHTCVTHLVKLRRATSKYQAENFPSSIGFSGSSSFSIPSSPGCWPVNLTRGNTFSGGGFKSSPFLRCFRLFFAGFLAIVVHPSGSVTHVTGHKNDGPCDHFGPTLL